MKTTILELNKNPYENGYISGKYFFDVVNKEDVLSYMRPQLKDTCKSMLEKLKDEYPIYYQEVCGKADALGMEVLEYFTCLCPEIANVYKEQCTTLICKKENGHFVISHNEDDVFTDHNFCLSKVWIDEENWFYTNDMVNMPFGNGFSWNSYGMVKTINYCHDEEYNIEQLPRYFAQRHISEAKSIDDLIFRCKEMKVASGYHVIGLDTNTNEAVSIEVHSDRVDVEYITDWYAHSNHFIHGNCEAKCDVGSNSVFRLEKARELFSDRSSNGLKTVLDYHAENNDVSIFQDTTTKNITIVNMTFDRELMEVILEVYVHNEQLKFKV